MNDSPLACTVRECGLLLTRRSATWSCARGHAYDVARAGYVNLLQPQDRRSASAGDSKEAIEARRTLLAAGVGQTILTAVAGRVGAFGLSGGSTIVDVGSGAGDLIGRLPATLDAVGIDLSTAAAEHAARRFPHATWVVANADRGLPVLDRSARLVLSINGRRHPEECARILTRDGLLLIAVPAADDLVELREAVQGARVERDRADAVVLEHAAHFTLQDRSTVRERHMLDRDALLNLLRGTYRGARLSASGRLQSLERLDVTLASDVLLFGRRT